MYSKSEAPKNTKVNAKLQDIHKYIMEIIRFNFGIKYRSELPEVSYLSDVLAYWLNKIYEEDGAIIQKQGVNRGDSLVTHIIQKAQAQTAATIILVEKYNKDLGMAKEVVAPFRSVEELSDVFFGEEPLYDSLISARHYRKFSPNKEFTYTETQRSTLSLAEWWNESDRDESLRKLFKCHVQTYSDISPDVVANKLQLWVENDFYNHHLLADSNLSDPQQAKMIWNRIEKDIEIIEKRKENDEEIEEINGEFSAIAKNQVKQSVLDFDNGVPDIEDESQPLLRKKENNNYSSIQSKLTYSNSNSNSNSNSSSDADNKLEIGKSKINQYLRDQITQMEKRWGNDSWKVVKLKSYQNRLNNETKDSQQLAKLNGEILDTVAQHQENRLYGFAKLITLSFSAVRDTESKQAFNTLLKKNDLPIEEVSKTGPKC